MPEELPKLIHPQGPESARLMIVIDAPTEDDATAGKLFSGKYTNIIKSHLNAQKIKPEQTYRTSLFKERLSYNGPVKKLIKNAVNIAQTHRDYQRILIDEISNLKPLCVLPIGEIAFNFLTGEKSLSNFRGSVLSLRREILQSHPELSTIKVVPSLSPKELYADSSAEVYVRLDYQRISSILDGSYVQEPANVFLPQNLGEAMEWFYRYKKPFGILDIETRFSIPVCIGFAFDRNNACVLPLLDSAYPKELLVEYWLLVDKILRETEWANQNMKFDLHRLRWFGFEDYKIVADTAIRASIIYPEFEKKLAFLNSIYTDMPYFKGEGKDSGGNRSKLYLYCGKDCISTFRVHQEQESELVEMGLKPFERQVQSLFWPYIRIERRGLLIDESLKIQRLAKYHFYYDMYKTIIRMKLNDENFNPNSPDQVSKLLYERFALPKIYNKQTGKLTTDEDAIDTHCALNCNEDPFKFLVIQLIRGCKKLHKVIEALETPTHPDGRMRCSYDLGGTNTGRTSAKKVPESLIYVDYSTKTPTYKTTDIGHSLQTFGKHGFYILGQMFGKDLRDIFVPTSGYCFIEGDLSQAEARVDAVLAEDWEFLQEFDRKPGVHCLTGSWLYECDPWDIKKDTEQYHISKITRHAAERNIYPSRLAMMTQKTLEFCTSVLDRIHARQPNIRAVFHQQVRDYVLKNRVLVSPHGRRRDFFGKLTFDVYNQAISQLPQATVSDQIKFSIPILEEEFKDKDVHFDYEGHDALMAEIREDFKEEYAATFKRVVERPINFKNCSLSRDFDLIIPVEMSFSKDSWGAMKKL